MLRFRPYSSDRHTPVGLLQTFLDAELTPADARVVQAHLDRCPACRADARVYAVLTASLRGLALPPDQLAMSRLRVVIEDLTA